MASTRDGRVEGKVAFVTGAARGQGRSHAVRLAEEGADVIAIDVCEQVSSVPYEMSTPDDLQQTVARVEALDRRIVAREVDVRDRTALRSAVDDGVAELGRLDIVAANAGIVSPALIEELTDELWDDMIDINLTGAWNTAKAAVPHIRDGGVGGAMVLTSSVAGMKGAPGIAHYIAAKHGVIGLMRALAMELAPENIRVNSVAPTQVNTPMIMNERMKRLFVPDKDEVTMDEFAAVSQELNAMPVPWVEPVDVSNALLFLVSDEGRYLTGMVMPVDAGEAGK